MNDWKFDQPENTSAMTTKNIIENNYPVLVVVHYENDHSWGFFCGTTDEEKDGRVISMKEAINRDSSLKLLFDLKPGWKAVRSTIIDRWKFLKL